MSNQSISVNMNIEGKNMVIAYVLWWFLGLFGIHRFYLGRTGTGITQLLLLVIGGLTSFILIGYPILAILGIWWVLDAFFVHKIVKEHNNRVGIKNSTISISKSGEFHNNDLDQLAKLHSLYEKGIINKEQYEKKKAEFI